MPRQKFQSDPSRQVDARNRSARNFLSILTTRQPNKQGPSSSTVCQKFVGNSLCFGGGPGWRAWRRNPKYFLPLFYRSGWKKDGGEFPFLLLTNAVTPTLKRGKAFTNKISAHCFCKNITNDSTQRSPL